jgi:16S rRNA (guanine527-N7)-methyltransferase
MALSLLGNGWLPRIDRVLAAFPGASRAEAATARESLARFLDLVVSWNQRMDLTAARSNDELADLMLADAAAISAHGVTSRTASDSRDSWLDIGSGAGAPGVALALLDPAIAMTLVEPRQKRVAFLRTALVELGLTKVGVERCRSSELDDRRCDVAVSRATLAPAEWLPEGARLAKASVWVLLARDEPPSLEGWQPDLDLEYTWPLTGAGRRAVRYVQQP